MVVSAARREPETRAGRTLSLPARARRGQRRQDSETPGGEVLLSPARPTHQAWGTRGVERGPPCSPGSAGVSASGGSWYTDTRLQPLLPGKNFRGGAN